VNLKHLDLIPPLGNEVFHVVVDATAHKGLVYGC
jgi:hypothetical protein